MIEYSNVSEKHVHIHMKDIPGLRSILGGI